jgi:hypothetical protein
LGGEDFYSKNALDMKTFDQYNSDGKLVCFEVSNYLLPRKKAISIIRKISDVSVLSINLQNELFCNFELGKRIFDIWEPFGDNSRYHIGEKTAIHSNELETIKNAFSEYKLGIFSFLFK